MIDLCIDQLKADLREALDRLAALEARLEQRDKQIRRGNERS